MSDEAVVSALVEFGENPTTAKWFDDGGLYLDIEDGYVYPKSEQELHSRINHGHLFHCYLKRWIDGLDDGQLLSAVQQLSKTQMSVSEQRYAKRSDLQETVLELVWPVLIAASSLYGQPINPKEGNHIDSESSWHATV